ncbi:hypothetical protein BLNAU_20130 [Blattamonas nauphoetae]|uniref:Uncharacterized protein n=1 Tax=Blattamonas nauphoetae TaxID=2049346 RepID=A0ABQ9WZM2_9EUKA|nr:hypothetical protein BLNAU_20130 [Blattamonas nauphoetae]
MTPFDTTINTSPGSLCPDCSDFVCWDEKETGTEDEKAVVFRSLVATLMLQPTLDVSLVGLSDRPKVSVSVSSKNFKGSDLDISFNCELFP